MYLKLIPYTPDNPSITTTFLRLLVEPIPKPAYTTAEDLRIPADIGVICQMGIIRYTCEESTMKEGDTILYKKLSRKTAEFLDTVFVEGKVYDVLFEHEVWSVNDQPWNLIFVQEMSGAQVNESGLILPGEVRGITAKGIVFRAPGHYSVKSGDNVEFRKQERGIYPSIEIEGHRYLAIHEADIFLVNGKIAPYRILVKVDIAAQKIKRHTTATGLIRSPLFQFMLHNMQVAEVVEIGEEAQKNYPDLKVGDQAITHHRVEEEQYRLIKTDFAKADRNVVTYEYRVLDGFSPDNRDVFGRIVNRKKATFASFGKAVFFEWNFEMLEKNSTEGSSLLLDFDTNLDKCTNTDDLNVTVKHKQEAGFNKAVTKRKSIIQSLSQCNLPVDRDLYDQLESELRQAEKETVRIGNYINGNHLVVCRKLGSTEKVIITYKELYPINIFGKKFLMGHIDYVVAQVDSFVAEVHATI